MNFGQTLGTACSSFAATNIDDMFVLVTFFAETASSKTVTPLRIVLGQYLGFTVIMLVSMIGYAVAVALPSEPIGFLGLLPMLLGIWKLLELYFPDHEEEFEINGGFWKVILSLSLITIMNGGDNIGTYIPLFSQARGAEIAVYIVTFYILLGVWCLAGWLIMKQKHILRVAEKYARFVVPFLYVGLGLFIIINSNCYPWSIEHIDRSASRRCGEAILAVFTTVILLAAISTMWWYRRRSSLSDTTSTASTSEEPLAGEAQTGELPVEVEQQNSTKPES